MILLVSINFYSQESKKQQEEDFKEIIVPYLKKTLKFVEGKGENLVTFVESKTPEVIKQYLMFEAFEVGFKFLLLIILVVLYFMKLAPEVYKWEEETSDDHWVYYFVNAVIILLSGALFFTITTILIKIIYMPELYLIDQFKNLL